MARVGGSSGSEPRLLFFLPHLQVGGTEMGLFRLLSRWQPRDIAVGIACLSRRGLLAPEFERLGVPIAEVDRPNTIAGRLARVADLARLMRRERVAVVENMTGMSAFYGALAGRLARVSTVISNQRDMGEWLSTRARRLVFRVQMRHLSTYVIVNARAIRDWLIAGRYCRPDRVAVIRLGVPVDVPLTSREATEAQRRHLGLTANDVVIGCVSMLLPVKGLSYLLEAVPAVLRCCPRARFVIVGEGPERARLERRRRELGVEHAFLLPGSSLDTSAVVGTADVCVLPSLSEGFPTAVLEYMRAARPVVATAVGGVAEVVVDGGNGFLVPPRDHRALAETLIRLIDDPALRQRLGAEGADTVRAGFDIDSGVKHYDLLYRELLRGRVGDFAAWGNALPG